MNNYDEKIQAKRSQIKKLQKDIEDKKSKISKLQSEVKQLKNAKDEEFSREFMRKMMELGLTSPDDRQAILDKIDDLALEKEYRKSEKNASLTDTPDGEQSEKQNVYENSPTEKTT